MLQHFWWGSVFLVTLPLAALALALAVTLVPSHVNETSDPVDNLGGVLSAVMVGALIVAINFAAVPNRGTIALGLGAIALLIWALIFFGLPTDLPAFLAPVPHQAETTGPGSSSTAEREPEIDSATGAPLMHLGPADLVAGSDALKHPAHMPKARPKSRDRR